jgi:hypothetical protein
VLLLVSADLLQILPDLLIVFLQSNHLFPLSFCYISHLFDRHNSDLFNSMINFLIIKWLPLDGYFCRFGVGFQNFFNFLGPFLTIKNRVIIFVY